MIKLFNKLNTSISGHVCLKLDQSGLLPMLPVFTFIVFYIAKNRKGQTNQSPGKSQSTATYLICELIDYCKLRLINWRSNIHDNQNIMDRIISEISHNVRMEKMMRFYSSSPKIHFKVMKRHMKPSIDDALLMPEEMKKYTEKIPANKSPEIGQQLHCSPINFY